MTRDRSADLQMLDDSKTAHVTIRHGGRELRLAGLAGDYIFERIRRGRTFYELDLLEYVQFVIARRHALRSAGGPAVAIDVGANIGNHAVFFGSFIVDVVVCVEPNPMVLPLLDENLAMNLSGYRVVASAVGARDGKCRLAPVGLSNVGGAYCVGLRAQRDEPPVGGAQGPEVQVRTLDSITEELRASHPGAHVALVKIDVEGMEESVLEGGTNTLLRERPEIFVEAASKARLLALRRQLAPFDYAPVARWASTPVYHFTHRPAWSSRAAILRYSLPNKIRHGIRRALS